MLLGWDNGALGLHSDGDTSRRPSSAPCRPAGAEDAQSSPFANRNPKFIVDLRTLDLASPPCARIGTAVRRRLMGSGSSNSAASRAVPRAPRPLRPRHGCPAGVPRAPRRTEIFLGLRAWRGQRPYTRALLSLGTANPSTGESYPHHWLAYHRYQ